MFFRITTLFVAMLVMVTFVNTFAQARPIRSLHHPRRFLLSRQNRNHTQLAGLTRRHLTDFNSGIPQHRKPRVRVVHRATSDDHGDLSAHDQYEAQLHELEAALDHYHQYGDSKSLQKYLNGFTAIGQEGSNGKSSDDSADEDKGAQTPAQDTQSAQNSSAKQDSDDDDHQSKQNADDCEDNESSQNNKGQDSQANQQDDSQQQQQPQQPSQSAPKPKKMKKVPKKKQHDSTDYTSPSSTSQSQSQPQPKTDQSKSSQPESYQQPSAPSSGSSSDSDNSGNSINGYTPPAFTTSASSPSTDSHYTGQATWYNTGLGACGIVNTDDHPIVAVSSDIFEQYNPSSGNPNHNALCGKKVEISWKGKKVHAFATDECPGCEAQSLDCSPNVFKGLDNPDTGRLDGITWRFL